MQVICEATQSGDPQIEASSFGCLNRIMALYYDKMKFYMEKALFGLTIMGMKNDEEDVAKLAIEFWCTVCEEELSIEDDNAVVSLRILPLCGVLTVRSVSSRRQSAQAVFQLREDSIIVQILFAHVLVVGHECLSGE